MSAKIDPATSRATRARLGPAVLAVLAVALLAWPARTEDPVALKTFELGRGPTLVLVHDLGMSRTIWMPMARRLLSTHRVVMVDLPGHGESPTPGSLTLESAAAALERVLAREKSESTVVVGHGLGGMLGLMVAREHPERMRGLVLVSAGLRVGAEVPDQQRQQFLRLLDERFDDFIKFQFRMMGRDSAQGVAMHAQAVRVPKAAMMPYLRELLVTSGAALTKNVKTPALVIASDRDTSVHDSAALLKQLGYDTLPQVTLRRVAGSGHYVMADQPDTLAARIAEFTTQVIAGK
jgi:pimeloyl-ACP methyl ester carboxylesterase